jgi:hypothetical protein
MTRARFLIGLRKVVKTVRSGEVYPKQDQQANSDVYTKKNVSAAETGIPEK